MHDHPSELVCPCGITFEPLPWFDAELDAELDEGFADFGSSAADEDIPF